MMKCYFCGGETAPGTVTDLYAEGRLYLAVEDVPADVCRQCGERYYTPDVARELLSITQKAKEHAALTLPGHRAEVAICQWGEKGGDGSGTVDDFWGVLVPPLVGKSFYTLKRHHEFRVEEMGDSFLLIVTSARHRRRLSRKELEGAWVALTHGGALTRDQIRRQLSSFNRAYAAAILAQMPGVEHRLNPITLIYREAK